MSRSIYEKIDEVRENLYLLASLIHQLPGDQQKPMAKYAFTELYASFDNLSYLGGLSDRTGDTAKDRPNSAIEAGHGGDGLSRT